MVGGCYGGRISEIEVIGRIESIKQYLSQNDLGIVLEKVIFFVPYLTDAGWPKAWAVFRMAKEVWTDEETEQ